MSKLCQFGSVRQDIYSKTNTCLVVIKDEEKGISSNPQSHNFNSSIHGNHSVLQHPEFYSRFQASFNHYQLVVVQTFITGCALFSLECGWMRFFPPCPHHALGSSCDLGSLVSWGTPLSLEVHCHCDLTVPAAFSVLIVVLELVVSL